MMIRSIVDSSAFQNGILAVVLLAGALVGLETDPGIVARFGHILHRLDQVVIALFAIEAVLKMAAHGRRFYRYFYSGWNNFDFAILVVCLLPADAEHSAVLRLVRVVRALRLLSALPRLQLLVGSLLKSLPSMGYIGLLLLILFYVYAVTGVFLWRDNDPGHFRNLPTALLTLFRVVTLEDWTDIMYTQMYGAHVYPSKDDSFVPAAPSAAPVVGAVYFVSFVLLGTMIILNLFIGVILNSMHEAQREVEERRHPEDAALDPQQRLARDLNRLHVQLVEAQRLLENAQHRVRPAPRDGG